MSDIEESKRPGHQLIMEQLASLTKRVADLEAATADTGDYGRRLHTFKNEIKEQVRSHREDISSMLAKHNEQRTEMEQSFEAHFNTVGGAINTIGPGLNRLEARANVIWNTMNALVRMIERVWSGVDQQPLSRATFEAVFVAAGRQVWDEAMSHEKSELARMRKEKAETGKVTPMIAKPLDPVDKVCEDLGNLAHKAFTENKAEMAELKSLRQEAAVTQAEAAKPELVITNK